MKKITTRLGTIVFLVDADPHAMEFKRVSAKTGKTLGGGWEDVYRMGSAKVGGRLQIEYGIMGSLYYGEDEILTIEDVKDDQ